MGVAYRGRLRRSVEEWLSFVIVVAMIAAGLSLFLAGLFCEDETNFWYVIVGGWMIGLGGDRLWNDFVGPFLASTKVK
jgi:hypothetical protein